MLNIYVVADFGCIQVIDGADRSRGIAGTRLYAPPEMVDGGVVSTAFDVWSLAISVIVCTFLVKISLF